MVPPAVEVSGPSQGRFVGNNEITETRIESADELPNEEVYGAAGSLGLQVEGQGRRSDHVMDGEEDMHPGSQKRELRPWSRTEDNVIVRLVSSQFLCYLGNHDPTYISQFTYIAEQYSKASVQREML